MSIPFNRPLLKCGDVNVLRYEGVAKAGAYVGLSYTGNIVLDEASARGALEGIKASKRWAGVNQQARGPSSLELDRAMAWIGRDIGSTEQVLTVRWPEGSTLEPTRNQVRVKVKGGHATLTLGHSEPNGFYGTRFVVDSAPVELSLCQIVAPAVPAKSL